MHHVIGALLIGAVAGGVAGNRDKRRPVVRKLVKGGIVAKRKAPGRRRDGHRGDAKTGG